MAKLDAELKLSGFDKLQKMLKPGTFPARMQREVRKATIKVGLIAEAAVKTAITNGDFADNKPLTIALKGSATPLVASGELLKAITSDAVAWDTVEVGVIKQRIVQGKDGKPDRIQDIAAAVHNGATVPVSDAMRNFFAWKARTEPEKGWKPLSPKTKVIIIRKRPFMQRATRKRFLMRYQREWEKAIQRAMKATA